MQTSQGLCPGCLGEEDQTSKRRRGHSSQPTHNQKRQWKFPQTSLQSMLSAAFCFFPLCVHIACHAVCCCTGCCNLFPPLLGYPIGDLVLIRTFCRQICKTAGCEFFEIHLEKLPSESISVKPISLPWGGKTQDVKPVFSYKLPGNTARTSGTIPLAC